MATKRKNTDVEKDFARILKIYSSCCSIEEIAKKLKTTASKVKTSLDKHPVKKREILVKLAENRKSSSNENVSAERKDEHKNSSKDTMSATVTENETPSGVVIDTSIVGAYGILQELENISKIVITSITIDELDRVQHSKDHSGKTARALLNRVIEDKEDKFVFAEITGDENLSPDDRIIKFCKENRSRYSLFTADKTMFLKAKMYKVVVKYFKAISEDEFLKIAKVEREQTTKPIVKSEEIVKIGDTIILFSAVQNEDGRYTLPVFKRNSKTTMVITKNGEKVVDKNYTLCAGDTVYISVRKCNDYNEPYYSFADYEVISDNSADVKLRACSRIYRPEHISRLDPKYQDFLKYAIAEDFFK